MAYLDTRISGIPCKVYVAHYASYAPDLRADSDWDYHGGTEIEFSVCDSRGRPAPWLERKTTRDDIARIEQEIIEWHNQADH